MNKPIGFDNWLTFAFITDTARNFTIIGSFAHNDGTTWRIYRGPNVSSITDAAAAVITTAEPHGLQSGQRVRFAHCSAEVAAIVEASDWPVTVLSSTTFVIPCSTAGGYASAVLTLTGLPLTTQHFTVGNETYTWRDAFIGGAANQVKIGLTVAASLDAAVAAVAATAGSSGTLFTSATTENADFAASRLGNTLQVRYGSVGLEGNHQTVESTMENGSWGEGVSTLSGGYEPVSMGSGAVVGVMAPNFSVAASASCIPGKNCMAAHGDPWDRAWIG